MIVFCLITVELLDNMVDYNMEYKVTVHAAATKASLDADVICQGHVIKNNAWVTVNNNFFVTSEAIRQWFSRVTKSRVKIIAESPHEWQKIVIHGNECIILFLTRYFMSWTHKSAKNYHRALISPLLPRAAFSDRALWRHNNWSVTSCERQILVLWRHICLLSLHAQFGAKAIFTSE